MNSKQTRSDEEYEEVDLRDVIRILLKRKKIVIGMTLAAVFAVLAVNFIFPKNSQVDAIIEVGSLENNGDIDPEKENLVLIEPMLQTKEKIDKDIYGARAREKLGYREMPEIKAMNTKGTSIIYLSIQSAEPEKSKTYLAAVCDEIIAEHGKKSESVKSSLESKILQTEEELAKLKEVAESRKAGDGGYYIQIMEMEKQLNQSRSALAAVGNTSVIKQPTVSEAKSRLGVDVALAAVIGLFAGIFSAFVIDWWRKS